MEVDRRRLLALAAGAAAAALGGPGRTALAPPGPSLNALAAAGGRRFGACLGTRTGGFADPAYLRLIAGQCGLIVPENELKWGWVRRSPTGFDFLSTAGSGS